MDFAGDIVEVVGISRSILDGSVQAVRGHEDFRIAGDRRGLMDDGVFEKTVYQPFEQRLIDQRILSMARSGHDTKDQEDEYVVDILQRVKSTLALKNKPLTCIVWKLSVRSATQKGLMYKILYKMHLNIYLHITTFANVTHMVKGMKVWNGSKTSMSGILSTAVLVLTLSFGFSISLEAQVPYKIRKVVIDPGHGGKDPGCNGHHSSEKEVALSIGLDLGKKT